MKPRWPQLRKKAESSESDLTNILPDLNHLKNNKLSELIEQFDLIPHPEGGWYREVIRSDLKVERGDRQKRNNITGVLFLLGENDRSCWHRVKDADEIWIYLQGAPLTLWRLDPQNKELIILKLDSSNPIGMISAGWWQAARCEGNFTLTTCCVGPGFDFADFEMLRDLPIQIRPDKAQSELI